MAATFTAQKKYILLLPPVVLLLITLLLSGIRGPFFVYNPDPAYEYLLTSLQLLQNGSAGYTGHPGTTLQLLGLPAILFGSLLSKEVEISIEQHVLTDPEFYLNAIHCFQTVAVCVCLAWCGLALSRSRGVGIALLFQSCFLVLEAPLTVLTTVAPESMMICAGLLLIPLLEQIRESGSDRIARGDLMAGILLGFGTASKLNFLPLWFLALIAGSWKRRIAILAAAAASSIVFTLPVFRHYREIYDKMVLILVHGGRFSQGSLSDPDFAAILATAGRLLASQTFLFLLFLILLIVYVLRMFIFRTWSAGEKRAFSFGGLAVLLLAIATIRYPGNRYLIPAVFPLIWLQTFLFQEWIRALQKRFSSWRAAHSIVVAVLILGVAGSGTVFGFFRWTKATTAHRTHVEKLLDFQKRSDCRTIPYYRASVPEFALAFGNHYADGSFSEPLNKLYPDTVFYDLFHENFYSFRGLIDERLIAERLERGECIYIRGLAWEKRLHPKLDIEPVFPGSEAIYRLKGVKLNRQP